MTEMPLVMPIEKQTLSGLARATARDVRAAWGAASPAVQVVAVLTVGAALSSSLSSTVPLASGLAIAMLVPAALVDWHQRRLPNAIVVAAGVCFVLASLWAAVRGGNTSLAGVGLGLALFAGPLLFLHLVSPESIGFGDVKTAAVLGLILGAVDWHLAAWALTAAAGSTAFVGIARRQSHLPFGPGLLAGALSCLLAAALLDLDLNLETIGF